MHSDIWFYKIPKLWIFVLLNDMHMLNYIDELKYCPRPLTQWNQEGKYNNVNGYRGPGGTMVNSIECVPSQMTSTTQLQQIVATQE